MGQDSPYGGSVKQIEQHGVRAREYFRLLQHMVDHYKPSQQMALDSQRWLKLAMAQASDDLQNSVSRDFGRGEQISYDGCKTRLIEVAWMGCQADEAYEFIRKGSVLVQ